MKRPTFVLTVLVGLLGVAMYATSVMATPGQDFTAAQQWKGVFDQFNVKTNDFPPHRVDIRAKGVSDVYVTRNAIGPGGHSGWHTHPGPSLIIVTAGEITAYEGKDRHCRPTRYTAGQGFIDPGDGSVHLLRNETSAPAETVAFQIVPKDAVRRIDAPASPSCSF
jgi:quercetin dioxygenase-like cupin family protein